MKLKKLLSIMMATFLTVGNLPMTAFALSPSDFSDFPNNWSAPALEVAVENGLIQGSEGKLNPDGLLSRAQLATILTNAFGTEEKISLNDFEDVDEKHWAYNALSEAFAAGFISGDGNKMYPDKSVTRQDTMSILARALNLDDNVSVLNKFEDADLVSNWAKGSIGAMISESYVNGYDGYINPNDLITRAQFAQIMSNITETYLNSAGTYTNDSNKSVIINVPGVTLKDMTVKGDVILADGVGKGDATLSNVTVEGRLVLRGGGSNSIHITDSVIGSNISVNNRNGESRLVISGSDIKGKISVSSDFIFEGDVKNLELK